MTGYEKEQERFSWVYGLSLEEKRLLLDFLDSLISQRAAAAQAPDPREYRGGIGRECKRNVLL